MDKLPLSSADASHITTHQNDESANVRQDQLLDALYGFLSEPDQFEQFLKQLDLSLESISEDFLAQENNRREASDFDYQQIDHHFSCAARIFDRMGLQKPSHDMDAGANGDQKASIWIFDCAGKLIKQNEVARQSRNLALGARYGDLSASEGFVALCAEQLAQKSGGHDLDVKVFVEEELNAQTNQHLFLIQRLDPVKDEGSLRVSASNLGWSPQIGQMMQQSFGLSGTEQDILRGVVEGKNLSDLAEDRKRSIETIRTQSKSLLRKTGARSQVGLVRLFAAIHASLPHDQKHHDNDQGATTHGKRTSFLEVAGVGKIQIDEYGSMTGSPVILFHGLFTGTGLTSRATAYIAQSGLRVIAPWRPGWSQSSPPQSYHHGAPQDFVAVIEAIMQEQGLTHVTLLGRFTGCIYAAAAAQALGERVRATIFLSPTAPVVDTAQIRSMHGWQKLFAYAITYAPAVVPILVRGMRQFLFRQEVNKFVNGFYVAPAADIEARSERDFQALLTEQVEHSFAQGTKGHELDLLLTGSNWSRYLEDIKSPLLIIHGEDNPVDPLSGSQMIAERAKTNHLTIVPERGQLFVHTEPELVWNHVREFIQTCALSDQ